MPAQLAEPSSLQAGRRLEVHRTMTAFGAVQHLNLVVFRLQANQLGVQACACNIHLFWSFSPGGSTVLAGALRWL